DYFSPSDLGVPAAGARRQDPLQNPRRARGTAGSRNVQRDDIRYGAAGRVALPEDPARAAAIPHGDHELRIGRRLVRAPQGRLHVPGDRARDEQQIRVTRARHETDTQPFHVVEGVVEGLDLELAPVAGAGVDMTDA